MKALLFILFVVTFTLGKPFIPEETNQTILTLETTPQSKEISLLLKKLEVDKKNLNLVDKLATLYIQLAKEKSDPRYMGYAQAILAPLLKEYPDSMMLSMHYIDILQYNHHFYEALVLLKKLTDTATKKPAPYLVTASIYQAQEEYALAIRSCKKLILRSSHLLSTTCISTMESHLGKLAESYELLQSTYAKADYEQVNQGQSSEKSWALTSLSDMAYRLNQKDKALFYLEEALKLDKYDYYALKKIADIYLEQKAYEKTQTLLVNFKYVESLLLRLTVAQHELNQDVALQKSTLQAHIDMLKLRKEKPHKEDVKLLQYLDIK